MTPYKRRYNRGKNTISINLRNHPGSVQKSEVFFSTFSVFWFDQIQIETNRMPCPIQIRPARCIAKTSPSFGATQSMQQNQCNTTSLVHPLAKTILFFTLTSQKIPHHEISESQLKHSIFIFISIRFIVRIDFDGFPMN